MAHISAVPGVKTKDVQNDNNPINSASTVLIIGASRGIGLEFARQLASRGAQVLATRRGEASTGDLAKLEARYSNVRTLQLDVSEETSVAALSVAVAGHITHLIYNAGIFGPRVPLGQVRAADMEEVFRVNTIGVVSVVQVLRPLLAKTQNGCLPLLAVVTSQMGSVHGNEVGGSYAYRASKSAVNNVCKSLAIDLRGEVSIVLLHPGWVATDMNDGKGFVDVANSVQGMLRAVEATDGRVGLRFVDYQGMLIPW